MPAEEVDRRFQASFQNAVDQDKLAEAIKIDFPEIPQNEIVKIFPTFKSISDSTGPLSLMDIKVALEKLSYTQTHIELKKIMAKIGKGNAKSINFYDFMKIYQQARFNVHGESNVYAQVSSINVANVGVKAAGKFFDAKAKCKLKSAYKKPQFKIEQKRDQDEQEQKYEQLVRKNANNMYETQKLFSQGENRDSEISEPMGVKGRVAFFEKKN